ncbi:nose resistant to fluoxetine protein 6-like [Culicoides brevitarsis]|uniref:nose resistant to fluoxetine protein 6-like n=1 Tax=Culicoides brevitarsis TaxID=469753 RepID=UPI00307B2FDC
MPFVMSSSSKQSNMTFHRTLFVIFFVVSVNFTHGQEFFSQLDGEVLTNFIENEYYVTRGIVERHTEDLKCIKDLRYFAQQLRDRRKWAMDMFDSWAKGPPSGIFYGNNINFGNFDQCLAVRHQNEEKLIVGKHCTVTTQFKDPEKKEATMLNEVFDVKFLPQPAKNRSQLAISLGICVPNSCHSDFIYNLTNDFLTQKFNMSLAQYNQEEFCSAPKDPFEAIDYVTIGIFGTLFGIIFLCTVYELWLLRRGMPGRPILLIFSAYRNSRKIFTSKTYNSPEVLHCLNGIRVLSLIWIVFGHSYMTFLMNPLLNKRELINWLQSYMSCTVLGGSVAVDSFFLLSGVLVCWVILKDYKRGTPKNLLKLYFHRYLRLAPSFAALVLLCVSLYRYFGDGPLWNKVLEGLVEPCQRNWWSTLLFIQNYYNPEDICLGHLWYLSVDMQLFIVAPFLIFLMHKWGKKVFPLLSAMIAASMATAFYNSYRNEFRVSAIDNVIRGRTLAKGRLIYYPTHIRMGAYIVGLMLGYILFTLKNRQIRLPRLAAVFGWILSITNCFTIVFGIYSFQQPDYNASIFVDATYEAIIRVLWALSLSWMIFACVKGYGSIINYFLSLSIWQPLGKLSYAIYLLHYPVQIYFVSQQREAVHFSNINAIFKFWGDFMMSTCLAVIWVLTFEMPLLGVQEMMTRRGQPTDPSFYEKNRVFQRASSSVAVQIDNDETPKSSNS